MCVSIPVPKVLNHKERYYELLASLLNARTVPLQAPGRTTTSKDATKGSWYCYQLASQGFSRGRLLSLVLGDTTTTATTTPHTPPPFTPTPCTFLFFSCLFVCLVLSLRLVRRNSRLVFSQRTSLPPHPPPAKPKKEHADMVLSLRSSHLCRGLASQRTLLGASGIATRRKDGTTRGFWSFYGE